MTVQEQTLLQAAREGDEAAFQGLIEPRRGELHAHCYRMLGSVHDAEDALQETLLRAWKALPRFEGRSSLRSWLYRIATNTSLNTIERRPKRVLPIDYAPASDPHGGPGAPVIESVWVEPYPDESLGLEDGLAGPEARYEQRESVELAFVAALQLLPPNQRSVLILREVLGFSAQETAETLETTTAAVNSALQRARKTVEERLPEQSQQQTLRTLGDEGMREVVEAYVDAWERADVDAIAQMLADDAAITMPPMATWFQGREAILVFLREWAFAGRWSHEEGRFLAEERRVRLVPVSASGQIAFGAYSWDADTERYKPLALQVLTLAGAQITEITGFVTPEALTRFGLPAELEAP